MVAWCSPPPSSLSGGHHSFSSSGIVVGAEHRPALPSNGRLIVVRRSSGMVSLLRGVPEEETAGYRHTHMGMSLWVGRYR